MNVNIRQAERKDFDSLLRLNLALFRYESTFTQTYNLDWTYSPIGRAYFAARIENGLVYIAEISDHVFGYLCASIQSFPYRSVNPICEIENMFIEESYRSLGIGVQLIEALKKELKKQHIQRMKVGALAQNSDGVRFYQKNGFEHHELLLEQTLNE